MAPKGNNYWELRLRSGRLNRVEDSRYFINKALEYFDHLEANPFNEVDYRGKDANKVILPKMRIPTKEDYALFCGFTRWEAIDKYRDRHEDFAEDITRVEKAIEIYQLQAASAGMVKENIVSRLLSLAEKTDNRHLIKLGVPAEEEYI